MVLRLRGALQDKQGRQAKSLSVILPQVTPSLKALLFFLYSPSYLEKTSCAPLNGTATGVSISTREKCTLRGLTEITYSSLLRFEGVVPFAVKGISEQMEASHIFVSDFETGGIGLAILDRGHR
jgi:hypothetical protein